MTCTTAAPSPAGATCPDPVDVLLRCAREAAVAAAALLAAVVAVADTAQPGFDADEVGFALMWTPGAARYQVTFGRYLTGVLPQVFAAFRVGDIDGRRAWVFFDVLHTVTDPVAAQIAARFIAVAPGITASQLRDRLRRAVLHADPDSAASRTRRSVAERSVYTCADGEGTATLAGIRLPADRAVAAYERIDAYARARHHDTTDRTDRTLDQLRADTFLDLLTGTTIDTPPIHRTGIIELIIPWDTALNLGNQPAHLTGYGPITAPVARDILTTPQPGTQLRTTITGPHGELLHTTLTRTPTTPTATAPTTPTAPTPTASTPTKPPPTAPTPTASTPAPRPPIETDPTRRTPGAALARWITTRDRTCRAPGCTTPARAADIDHTIAHTDGGPTSHDNLAILCRHHHRTKHNTNWTITQPTPGTLTWTSPTGRTYHREPDPPDNGCG